MKTWSTAYSKIDLILNNVQSIILKEKDQLKNLKTFLLIKSKIKTIQDFHCLNFLCEQFVKNLLFKTFQQIKNLRISSF